MKLFYSILRGTSKSLRLTFEWPVSDEMLTVQMNWMNATEQYFPVALSNWAVLSDGAAWCLLLYKESVVELSKLGRDFCKKQVHSTAFPVIKLQECLFSVAIANETY